MSFKYIDLFAGLGGFHLALNSLGGKCVFASEIDENLRGTYLANHGISPAGDIRKIRSEDIPEHDLLAAGFPCQPFSKAGLQKGFNCDDHGNLFFEIERILATRQPKYVLLENVPNITSHDNGRTIKEIFRRLQALDYDVDLKIYSPHEFGIPQFRNRAYIVGALGGLGAFKWPSTEEADTNIQSILDINPKEARLLSPTTNEILNLWDEIIQKIGSENIPGHPIWSMEWGADYPYQNRSPFSYYLSRRMGALKKYRGSFGEKLENKNSGKEICDALPPYALDGVVDFPDWKKHFIFQNRKFYESNKKNLRPYIPKIKELHPSFQKLEWNLNRISSSIFKQIIQFRASGIRIKTTKYAPSLVAISYTQIPIVGWERRYMTLKECMRLQNLENLKWMPDQGNESFRALGNAVNVKVVSKIGESLLNL